MDPISLASGYQGAKFALDSLRALLKMKLDAETIGRVVEAITRVTEVQASLVGAQETILRYQEELLRLQGEVDDRKAWQQRAESYPLFSAPGGGMVRRFSGEPAHFACPTCFEANKISVLQNSRSHLGFWECKPCTAEYRVEPSRPAERINYPQSGRFD